MASRRCYLFLVFIVLLQVTVKCPDGQDIVLNWSRVRSFDKEVASMFLSHVKEHDRAT